MNKEKRDREVTLIFNQQLIYSGQSSGLTSGLTSILY